MTEGTGEQSKRRNAVYETTQRAAEHEQTEVELWPEEDESEDDFMDRCIEEMTPCIGDRAEGVCADKWDASGKLGKKGFVTREALTGNLALAPCGRACLACEWADAPFEAHRWSSEGK